MSVVPGLAGLLPLVVNEASGVVAPTAPANVVRPPVVTVTADAPSRVPLKAMAASPVEVNWVAAAPRVTLSPNVWAPVVRTKPPLMAVVPGAVVAREVSGVPAPTGPTNVVAPAVFTVTAAGPSKVLLKETAPPPVEANDATVPAA